MTIITRERPGSAWLAESQTDWRRAGELINEAQYKLVAEFLHKIQIENEQTGNVILAEILAVIRQICLACDQCQVGAEWHWQAYAEASGRERELRQQLSTILELVGEESMLGAQTQPVISACLPTVELRSSVPAIPSFIILHNMWQRLQETLGWGSMPQLVQPEASLGWVGRAVPPAPGRAEALAASPAEVGVEKEKLGSSSLVVYCLGPFRVYKNEQLIEKWPGQKCKSIFKYMLIHRESPVHQEILMDLFWPDIEPEAARRNLYQAIYSLRQTLQNGDPNFPYILCEGNCYRINPELGLWVDSEAFISNYKKGQRLEREGHLREAIKEYELAESLYEGEFLIEDLYEDWPLVQRQNLKLAHLDILDRLSQFYFEQEQFAMGIAFCQKLLVEDNCREDAHRRLMRCYQHQGQRHLALRQYHLCVEALKQELDVPPMPATDELYRQIQ